MGTPQVGTLDTNPGELSSRARANTPPVLGAQDANSMKIDVLQYMRRGTSFLKYGKRGYPHFRQFQLSGDNMRLLWFSKSKKLKDTLLELGDVTDVVMGQTTPVFDRHRTPYLASSSFSLLYNYRHDSINLISKDPNEFKIWTRGLQHITSHSSRTI